MKTGREIQDLWKELDRQNKAKRDFVADTRAVAVRPVAVKERETLQIPTALEMQINEDFYPVSRHALRQIGEKIKIPAKYVDRLAADHPDMLAYNVNALFSREPKNQMVRTLDGNVRAFLSDRFRPLDNHDLAMAVIPHLHKANAVIESAEVTDQRLYIKASLPELVAELEPPPGAVMGEGHQIFFETVKGGVCVRNSEVGLGKLEILPSTFTKRCTNYATFPAEGFGKIHLGSKIGSDGETNAWEYFTDSTKEKSDAAVWAQVNDLCAAAMDGRIFEKIVEDLKRAQSDKLDPGSNIPKIVEVTAKKFGMTKDDESGVLFELIQAGDLSRYGLHAAVTRYSNDVADYDKASELELVGGKIIELPKNQWSEIARAA